MDEELLLTEKQRKCFFEMASTAGGGAVIMVEMTVKDLEHYMDLAGRATAEVEG
jgi:hypothetical protein